jgi:hypothetical protein
MWKSFFEKKQQIISFEDIQFCIMRREDFILINTMPVGEQGCLIQNTVPFEKEETIINGFINNYNYSVRIFVYGKNSSDESVEKKCSQLVNLGFSNVYLYKGGMFEWMLLQDIYGEKEFPTTIKVLDILKFKPIRQFGGLHLSY